MSVPEFIFDRVTADIRRHMEGVLALTEQLGRSRLSPDAEACVASVAEMADAVRRTLDGALDLRTVAADGLSLQLEPLRLRDLADAVQARWHSRAAEAGVTLLVSYDGDPEAAALAAAGRLAQIFDGFIGEAVGAQRRGAVEVSLRTEPTPKGVAIMGRVRGPQDADWAEQNLESRIRSIADRLGTEAAMGAMLARRIVASMGGRLTRETNPGCSETVGFELTLGALAQPPAAATPASARPAHVLVVDDNATNRMVAQSLVQMFDCTCECAEDGVEAVEAARSGRFDLILMDIRMPRMDGVAAARAIRALPGAVRHTPIIALTANADPDDATDYLQAGMNGVVEKPMKPEHLLAALRQVLGQRDAPPAARPRRRDASAA